jgi:poly(hydroxyalkanoate) depolymerase family esterase
MTFDIQQLMREATRLTQGGDLQAATAAIQAALGGAAQHGAPVAANEAWMRNGAIDVESRDVSDVVPADAPEESAAPQPQPQATQRDATVAPAQFLAGSFGTASGKRDYKLYIPAGAAAADQPLPLVVMLHGCTQTPDDFAAGTAMNDAAQAQGCYVLYPAQSQQANPQRCWNWFKHTHQQRGRGEPALLAGMTRQVMGQHRIDPKRVYVAGLSAGGAMAAILGDTYPDVYAAVGVHSGLAAGAASDLPSAMAAMQGNGKRPPAGTGTLPTIVFHGDADSTVHPSNGEQVTAASVDSTGTPAVEQHQQPGGRRSTRTVHRDASGAVRAEHWVVHGAAHAWAGGSASGSYTDARGPDATAEMLRFFLEHPRV